MNEIQLAEQAIKGDHSALLQILKQDEQIHYRICYSYFHNEHDALDAMQEFTLRAFKKVKTVKKPEYLSTWLVRVLINVCHNLYKKKQRIELKEFIDIPAEQEPDITEISELIKQLPEKEQTLIYLKYYQDMKNIDIARELDIPEGTVKSRLHSVMRKLRNLVLEGGNS